MAVEAFEPDSDFRIKIIDFGLAKLLRGNAMANSKCGSPENLAPEIIKGEEYNFAVDWWAVGIVTFQIRGRTYLR